eukprot:TRINITY_DN9713_c0_g1_i2.p1 TRINITY_DN9713_c0_g1~~TRINITY_DN9713_c0_g1_i2.p1  ORF type:complete len:731 (-),score=185.24 TRINITY_DN9713_c0_g1_i2:31-2223(-)
MPVNRENLLTAQVNYVSATDGNTETYGLKAQNPNENPPELRTMNLETLVIDSMHTTVIEQTYVNANNYPLEAIYKVLLPSTAHVIEFVASLDGQTIKAKVKEEAAAKQEYEEAIARGDTAVLAVAEDSKIGNLFSMSLGNILPGKTIQIRTKYIDLATALGRNTHVIIPKDIFPTVVVDCSIRVTCSMSGSISGFASTINMESESDTSYIYQGKSVCQDTEFVIETEQTEPTIIIERNPEAPESQHVMVNFSPSFDYTEDLAEYMNDIVFLVDRSGSMGGSRIGAVKFAMNILLRAIPTSSKFNILGFGTRFQKLFNSSELMNEYSFDRAMQYCSTMDANLGGTNIYKALSTVFNEPTELDYPRVIIILTDGYVGQPNELLRLVDRYKEDIVLHSVAIPGCSEKYLKQLSTIGGGKFIKGEGNEIISAIANIMKSCIISSYRDIYLELPDNFVQYPNKIAPILAGSRLLAFGATHKKEDELSSVMISSVDPCGEEFYQEVTNIRYVETDVIGKFAAVQRIRELMLYCEDEDLKKDEIINLCIKYQVPAKGYAAFIAVFENEDVPDNLPEMQTKTVDTESPNENLVLNDDRAQDTRKMAMKEKCKRPAKRKKRRRPRNYNVFLNNNIRIVLMQNFNGSIPDCHSLVFTNPNEVEKPADIEDIHWSTLVALIYLERANSWDLNVAKARNYLAKALGKSKFDQLYELASEILNRANLQSDKDDLDSVPVNSLF